MEIGPKPVASHQKAPVEVWELIVDYAAYLPNELGIAEWTGTYDPLELGSYFASRLAASSASVQVEIQNRRNLSLVSRGWNTTIFKRLYQSRIINNLAQLRQVHQQITTRSNIAPSVKRIDVGNIHRNEYDDAFALLKDIVEICPKLVSLMDISSTAVSFISHFISYLHKESSHSIHSVQQLTYRDANLFLLSINFSNLRALLLDGYFCKPHSAGALSFPQLEILIVSHLMGHYDYMDEFLSTCHFPRLHSLTIGSYWWATAVAFLKNLGPQLRTLHITDDFVLWSPSRYAHSSYYSSRIIPEVVSACVHLEQLIVPTWTQNGALSKYSSLLAIRSLEFTYQGVKENVCGSDEFFQNHITKVFPKIQSLRLSGIPTEAPVGKDELATLRCWIDYMETYEDVNRSNGITMQVLTDNGKVIRSAEGLKQHYQQLVPKRIFSRCQIVEMPSGQAPTVPEGIIF